MSTCRINLTQSGKVAWRAPGSPLFAGIWQRGRAQRNRGARCGFSESNILGTISGLAQAGKAIGPPLSHEFLKPSDVVGPVDKIGRADQAAMKRDIGIDAADDELLEGATQPH